MNKFTHINQYYQIIRTIEKINKTDYKIKSPIKFQGTCKLHGTNSGVTQFDNPSGKGGNILYAQSRSRIITPEDDNYGFAKFVEERTDIINEIIDEIRGKHGIGASKKITLFGEWIGPGIQNGVAINKLKEKQWVLFAVKVTDIEDREGDSSKYIDAVPYFGGLDQGDKYQDYQIYSIGDAMPWEVEIDFDSQESKEKAALLFDKITAEVETQCPWARRFGIEGVGEGVVWIPIGEHWGNSDLFFKTKGEKHKVVKAKKNTEQLSPEILGSIDEFLEFALTENRLEQGLDSVREMEHDLSMKSMGSYLKWVGQDILRECSAELEENGLEWKQVQKAVTQKAREFFMKEMKKC